MPATKAKKLAPPSWQDRIAALHEEIEALVATFVDARAAECPGVPKGVIEHLNFGRCGGCRCEELKILANAKK
jgi:hypothetical protein